MKMKLNFLLLLVGLALFAASTTTTLTVVDAFSYDFPLRQQLQQRQHRSSNLSPLRVVNNADNDYDDDTSSTNPAVNTLSRRQAFQRSSTTAAVAAATSAAMIVGGGGIGSMLMPEVAAAANAETAVNEQQKQLNLSNDDIMKIISKDMTENQFLVNGKLTRSIYDESSTFQDEIDTYQLDKWIDGTSKLFDSSRSKVVLVDNSLQVMKGQDSVNGDIEFRFVEYLCFNIPFLKPIVYLSGKLELKRNPTTGLIISYQEKWDQNIYEVLSKKSKLFSSSLSNDELNEELDVFYKLNANNISKK